jgi:uncharacterized protein
MRRGMMTTAVLLLTMGATIPAQADDMMLLCADFGQALIKTDPDKVVSERRRLADQGNADGQYVLGSPYANGRDVPQDYVQAMTWFSKAADQGYADAQTSLGVMYSEGHGVPQSYAEAMKWYRKAADQGNAWAQSNLGVAYAKGQGVQQDYAEAAKWFRMAAEQGDAAQYNLGTMYATGKGVPRDYVQAHLWLNLAAAQGNANAAENRDLAASKMTPSQIEKAQALAAAWKPTTGQ